MIGQLSLHGWMHYHPGKFHLLQEIKFASQQDLAAKISLYFSSVILPFRFTIGLAENTHSAVHIITDPPSCLTVGRRQSRSYACPGALQTGARLENVLHNV
ncbi:hypothetical protein TNCV_4445981 [Trichonephila clavipes]|nr:hypothetical protein TNCV_4445981 [Trichonephila clavipes]